MAKGDPHKGLLIAIIDAMNELGPDRCYRPEEIVARLQERGHWKPGQAQTPERTVNTYFTENPDIFWPAYGSEYSLKEAYWKR